MGTRFKGWARPTLGDEQPPEVEAAAQKCAGKSGQRCRTMPRCAGSEQRSSMLAKATLAQSRTPLPPSRTLINAIPLKPVPE